MLLFNCKIFRVGCNSLPAVKPATLRYMTDLAVKHELSRCNSGADGIVRMEENFPILTNDYFLYKRTLECKRNSASHAGVFYFGNNILITPSGGHYEIVRGIVIGNGPVHRL